MRCTLGATGLLPRFAGRIFSADDVPHAKPAPDLFLLAARSLPRAPEDCVVVDDSPVGMRAARAAGMRALGFAAMMPAERLLAAGAHAVFRQHGRVAVAALASRPVRNLTSVYGTVPMT